MDGVTVCADSEAGSVIAAIQPTACAILRRNAIHLPLTPLGDKPNVAVRDCLTPAGAGGNRGNHRGRCQIGTNPQLRGGSVLRHTARMDLDALLDHYFHTLDPAEAEADVQARGVEQLRLDVGVEQEPGRKFALWVVMEALGVAPVPADAFAEPEEVDLRRAAEEWLDATYRMGRG